MIFNISKITLDCHYYLFFFTENDLEKLFASTQQFSTSCNLICNAHYPVSKQMTCNNNPCTVIYTYREMSQPYKRIKQLHTQKRT